MRRRECMWRERGKPGHQHMMWGLTVGAAVCAGACQEETSGTCESSLLGPIDELPAGVGTTVDELLGTCGGAWSSPGNEQRVVASFVPGRVEYSNPPVGGNDGCGSPWASVAVSGSFESEESGRLSCEGICAFRGGFPPESEYFLQMDCGDLIVEGTMSAGGMVVALGEPQPGMLGRVTE